MDNMSKAKECPIMRFAVISNLETLAKGKVANEQKLGPMVRCDDSCAWYCYMPLMGHEGCVLTAKPGKRMY